MTELPQIIQGGMGVAVSDWRLARSVSRLGQLGVVSGTALAVVLSRRLQGGDPGGHMRRALGHLPVPAVARRVLADHFVAGGRPAGSPYRTPAMPSLKPSRALEELTVAANFVEVFLAKQGHGGLVGINLLEKIQMPTAASLYGAMLAGVDYVLMGAGIPRAIPGALDRLAEGEPVELRIDTDDATGGEAAVSRFDPRAFGDGVAARLRRPRFLAIVASSTLASALVRKATGRIDGFVVEGASAGGHNAPPRGPLQLDDAGQPVYGERDLPDLAAIHALGLPFWLAGSYGVPGGVAAARELGATGVQAGTVFAMCEESGLATAFKRRILELSRAGQALVRTDPLASPTGFPFKVVQVEGTLADTSVYEARPRKCDLGYLRRAFRRGDGSVGYRCPAEPVADYVRKGGAAADTVGRKCVCNGLLAAIGLGRGRSDEADEPALLTAGVRVADIARFARAGCASYTAAEVIEKLLGPQPAVAG